MKRFIACIIIAATAISAVGCGKMMEKPKLPDTTTAAPAETTTLNKSGLRVPMGTLNLAEKEFFDGTEAATEAVTERVTIAETAAPVETEAPAEPTTPSTGGILNPDGVFGVGTFSGNRYENEFIGIGCTVPAGWRYYSLSELCETNGMSTSYTAEEYADAVADEDLYYDMYAIGENGADSININLEKVNSILVYALDVEELYEDMYPEIAEVYEEMGYTDLSYSIEDVYIDGKAFPALTMSATISGISSYFTAICIKCNGYVANITVGTFIDDGVDDILADFYLT